MCGIADLLSPRHRDAMYLRVWSCEDQPAFSGLNLNHIVVLKIMSKFCRFDVAYVLDLLVLKSIPTEILRVCRQ